jgi:hypothetical protein
VYLKALCCEVLARQAYYAAALSPHVVDIELVAKGLHNEPDRLRAALQARLDAVSPGQYDAILLGYGLCSNSIAGLSCPHTRLVVPRAHDCITLLAQARYGANSASTRHLWYTADYIERGGDNDHVAMGTGLESEEDMARVYAEYVEKYGQDNADYLMEVMGAWQQHYDRAAYIEPEGLAVPDYAAQVQETAARRGWRFQRLAGDMLLVRDLIEGRWDDERFLVVAPGDVLAPSYDNDVIQAGPAA